MLREMEKDASMLHLNLPDVGFSQLSSSGLIGRA